MTLKNSRAVIHDLADLSSPERARSSMRFFKTSKGQYGYGDTFIGVSVPDQRIVAKRYASLELPELAKLLASKVHEHRLTALIILGIQFASADSLRRDQIVQFYLQRIDRVNNWDLVDSSAAQILGMHLIGKSKRERKILETLSVSHNIWHRRIAIIATHAFIRQGNVEDAIKLSEMLLSDTHDLMYKAVGWTLREVGKRSLPALEAFLQKHATQMPRTALRYAIERFPESVRKEYLKIGKQ